MKKGSQEDLSTNRIIKDKIGIITGMTLVASIPMFGTNVWLVQMSGHILYMFNFTDIKWSEQTVEKYKIYS